MDSHVSELIKNHRFKEAHKALSKRLKKSPNDATLLIPQAEIYLISGEFDACKKLCTTLCTRKPPITDYACLTALFDIACKLSSIDKSFEVSEVTNLWSNAIQATGTKERHGDLAEEWASQCIKHEQWSLLAKAALTLQRQMPMNSDKRRQYWFWQITAYYLAGLETKAGSNVSATTNAERTYPAQLDQKMAMSLLGKAVKDMPYEVRSEDVCPPGLWISNLAELQLLYIANLEFGTDKELCEILADRRLQSLCAKSLSIQQLERSLCSRGEKALIRLWDWAYNHLQHALDEHKFYLLDNWDYWAALLWHSDQNPIDDQSLQIDVARTSLLDSTRTMIYNACHTAVPKTRAPQLAELRFQWHNPRQASNSQALALSEIAQSKIDLFSRYFHENCTQGYVAEDLDAYIPQLDCYEFVGLRKKISQDRDGVPSNQSNAEDEQLRWLASESNSLKVDYVYIETQLLNHRQFSRRKLCRLIELFASNCVGLYRVSLTHTATLPSTSTEPGDTACVLAARAFILLSVITANWGYRNQALCLLTFIISQAKHNFEARLDHVIHCLAAGFPSSAWEAFQGLDVKKILHEKISPLMFTRISTVQPFPSPQFNAYDVMQTALHFYEHALLDMPDYQELAFKHENYAGTADMRDFVRRLRYSPTRLMMIYESRRIARLTNNSYDATEVVVDHGKVFAEFDRHTQSIPLHSSLASVHFRKDYLTWLVVVDAAMELATCAENNQLEKIHQKSTALLMLHTAVTQSINFGSPRTFEEEFFSACQHLVDVVTLLANGSESQTTLTSLLEKLETSLKNCFVHVGKSGQNEESSRCFVPSADWYHENWVCLDLCQAACKLSVKLLAFVKRKWPLEQFSCKPYFSSKAIQRVSTEQTELVKKGARAIKASIEKAQQRNELVEQMLGPATDGLSALTELMGKENIETILAGLVASSQLALEGIGQFQMH